MDGAPGPVVVDPERFVAAIIGRMILAGDIGDDGLHLLLDDGRCLIFTGTFIVATVQIGKGAVH